MKRIAGILIGVLFLMVTAAQAFAQAVPVQNFKNMLFFVSGCSSYVPQTAPPPAGAALCVDTSSYGLYVWNGTAFVAGGTDIWASNGGAGQTTATTTFFTAQGNSTNSTTEAATMELVVPSAAVAKNLNCYVSASPGAAKSDTFTIRSATALGGSMGNSSVSCAITGASATSCSDTTHSLSLAAGSVMDIEDVTVGSAITARTIACAFSADGQ